MIALGASDRFSRSNRRISHLLPSKTFIGADHIDSAVMRSPRWGEPSKAIKEPFRQQLLGLRAADQFLLVFDDFIGVLSCNHRPRDEVGLLLSIVPWHFGFILFPNSRFGLIRFSDLCS
jgi:hypothetical protein